MRRPSGAALFSLTLAALAAYAVYAALRWPPKAALFPLTMAVPLLALATVQVVLDLRGPPPAAAAPLATRRALAVLGWMGGFILLVALAGFPVAVPIFVFSYLLLQSREGWAISLGSAAAAWGAFYLLFIRLLHFPFDDGLIRSWFQ
jgi:hypothetical protein